MITLHGTYDHGKIYIDEDEKALPAVKRKIIIQFVESETDENKRLRKKINCIILKVGLIINVCGTWHTN